MAKKKSAKASILETGFGNLLGAFNMPTPEREYPFAKEAMGRKWRFDFAYVPERIAIEIEGGTWTGGRHSRGSGIQGDCEKYNAAVLLGWRVLRYTTTDLRQKPVQVMEQIKTVLADASQDAAQQR
jgi:very-short-patch-repair endonuclease